MRLGAKLRISYVGIVLVAVSLVLALIIENAQRDLKEKISKDFEVIARIEADNVDNYMNGKLTQVRALAHDPVFVSGDAAAMTRYVNSIKKDDSSYAAISVVTPAGKVLVSTDGPSVGRSGLWDAGLLSKARQAETGEIFFRYSHGPTEGKDLYGKVFTPITGKSNRDVISVLAISLDMGAILKDEEAGQSVAGKTAYFVDNQSTMVVTRDGAAQIFTPLVYIQENSVLRGDDESKLDGHVVYKDPTRGPVVAGYAFLNENGEGKGKWSVISMAPQKEVFYPAIRLRNRIIVLGVAAVTIAWIIAFFVARGITLPVIKLVNVTDMIAKGDLSQRAETAGDDEVADLARSFNKMTDELNMAIVARDQDIIERRNAEEKLREEMEAKAKFVALISHEFQTPLTLIREGIGIMLVEGTDNLTPRQKDILKIAKKGGENLAHLIKDITEFHRLEAELSKFNMAANDIDKVVADVHNSMLPLLAEKRGVQFVVKAGGKMPEARFDMDKITLVLTNIVNMAIRSTEKGSVTVSTALESDNAVRVSVEDSGSSIDKDHLPTLFDKFDIPAKDRDKKAGGTGLGLTICREIIKKHNGKIWAEPRSGQGMIINFVLPLSERRV